LSFPVVFRGVLAEIPHVPLAVLRIPVRGLLEELGPVRRGIQYGDGRDTHDRLRLCRDLDHVGLGLPVPDALVDDAGPGLEGADGARSLRACSRSWPDREV